MGAGIYDIHCHLNDSVYIENDMSSMEIVQEAALAGVDIINNVGFDIKSSKVALIQAEKNLNVFAVIGIHPNEAHLFTNEAHDVLDAMANGTKVVAIGEIGLDYSRTYKYKEHQKESLIYQIEIAKKHNLPIMFHVKDIAGSVEAYDDLLEIIKEQKVTKGVIHSFEGTWKMAKKFIEQGLSISLSGRVTFDKDAQEIAKNISLNSLMIESDAPYATPRPFERKVNHPKFMPLIVQKITEIRGTSQNEVISATRENAKNLFFINN
ncbi:TatD family hydrolase [[Acholeplasma] multilocale]|uniref:TatD family hydrolase n=1 Tax=[Acholeplasma] multilocale TaxID=264638 RepID=UPI000553530B|nr:TatD family hydrolase [[Acholeplasma] multilocale]